MANQKIIHGVCINTDLIKTVKDLKEAKFFEHLPNPGELEASAAIELGFVKEKIQKED